MGSSPIAILCNGPSLEDHAEAGNLKRIPCETIGLNRSWPLLTSSYHVMVDPKQWEDYQRITGNDPSQIPNLHTGPIGPKSAKHIEIMASEEPKFSFDVFDYGAWLCGAVAWVGLQLAVTMKRNPIYFFGLDLRPRGTNGKWYGGTWDPISEPRQRELFGYAKGLLCGAHGIDIINVVMDPNWTKCHAFPKRTFEQCFPEANQR